MAVSFYLNETLISKRCFKTESVSVWIEPEFLHFFPSVSSSSIFLPFLPSPFLRSSLHPSTLLSLHRNLHTHKHTQAHIQFDVILSCSVSFQWSLNSKPSYYLKSPCVSPFLGVFIFSAFPLPLLSLFSHASHK